MEGEKKKKTNDDEQKKSGGEQERDGDMRRKRGAGIMNHISISLSLSSLMVLIFKCYIIKKLEWYELR